MFYHAIAVYVCEQGQTHYKCLEISEMNKLYRAFEGLHVYHLAREEYLKTFTAYTL